jgi:serine/threonine-protein kinase RsbW
MSAGEELILDSRIEEIRKLGPWLAAALAHEEDEAGIAELELALVELVSNTIRHGYKSEPGHAIQLRLERLSLGRVRIEIRDHGAPIPAGPLGSSDDRLAFDADNLDALPESGLGLAMAREVVDRMDYRAAADGNVMVIEKTLGPSPAS